jgi:hypothetical protein
MTPGKKQRGMIAGMPKEPTLASDRLALLIKQMQRDLGPARGADAKIAKLLGIDRSSINRVPTSERGISLKTIEGIRARIRMKSEFFSEPKIKQPHYRAFLEADSPLWDALPPGIGRSPTPHAVAAPVDAAPASAVDGKGNFDAMLAALGATELERAAWAEYVAMFPLPYYDATHLQTFIGGLRKQLSLQAAIDNAVTKSAESEMRASGRRKVDDDS